MRARSAIFQALDERRLAIAHGSQTASASNATGPALAAAERPLRDGMAEQQQQIAQQARTIDVRSTSCGAGDPFISPVPAASAI